MIVVCFDSKQGSMIYEKKLISFWSFVIRNEETNTEYGKSFTPFHLKILPKNANSCKDKHIMLILGWSNKSKEVIAITYRLNFKGNEISAQKEGHAVWVRSPNEKDMGEEYCEEIIIFDASKPYIINQDMSRIAFCVHDAEYFDDDDVESILDSRIHVLTFPRLELISTIDYDTIFKHGINQLRPIDFLTDDVILFSTDKLGRDVGEYICGVDINSKMVTILQKIKY